MFTKLRKLKDSLSNTGMVPDFLHHDARTAGKVDEDTQKADAMNVMEKKGSQDERRLQGLN